MERLSMRHFRLTRVDEPATGKGAPVCPHGQWAVRVRVTGLTIGRTDAIHLEPDGYGGYRVKASTSSGPMTPSQLETALEYVRIALAEHGLGGFGRPATKWSDILSASRTGIPE
jgi:hypothetical protein